MFFYMLFKISKYSFVDIPKTRKLLRIMKTGIDFSLTTATGLFKSALNKFYGRRAHAQKHILQKPEIFQTLFMKLDLIAA